MIQVMASNVSSIASAISSLCGFLAVVFAYKTIRFNKTNRIVDIHVRFQSDVRAIQRSLPPEVNDPNWEPSKDNLRNITMYWYLVFDEWFACTKLSPEMNDLWKEVYLKGVKGAFRLPAFKHRIEEIFKDESSFLGHGIEFKNVLDTICFEATGKRLSA